MNAYTLATTLKDEHTLLVFDYGSVVYGTLTEFSDHDVVAIVDDEIDLSEYTNGIFEYHWDEHPLCPDSLKNQDWQFINERRWIEMIKAHHIVWLECYSLPKEHILKGNPDDYMKYFTLDKWTLRQVISQIASNAWAKAGKKMTVEKDFDLYRGQKSLFHSLRIMMFGIQIARDGRITDYKEANYLWDEIYKMGNCGWPVYAEKYKALSNKLHSDFVALCPKPDEYKKENQRKNKKMENKKGFNINEKIVSAMTDYKDVSKQLTDLKQKGDTESDVYKATANGQQKLKKRLDVYKLVKTAFMEHVTNMTNCEKLVKREVLTWHKEVDEQTQKEYWVIDQEVNERMVLLPLDVQQSIIEKMITVRKKNVDIYTKNGRPEMASNEQSEIDVLNEFMPKEATREEVEEWVRSSWPAGITQSMMGYVIGESKKAFERVDGKMVSEVVRSMIQK